MAAITGGMIMSPDQIDIIDRADRIFFAMSTDITMMLTSPSREVEDAAGLLDLLFDELCVCRIDLRCALS
jgi:hypothetical protein